MDTRPRLRLMVVAVIALAAVWLLLRSYTSPAARECQSLYRAARTAADTAGIDTVFVATGERTHAYSCGFMRMTARWQ